MFHEEYEKVHEALVKSGTVNARLLERIVGCDMGSPTGE